MGEIIANKGEKPKIGKMRIKMMKKPNLCKIASHL